MGLTPLLTAPHHGGSLRIYGSVFEGGGPWEQWFNRMVLASDDQFVEITMKANLHELNRSRLPRDTFKTMDVLRGSGKVSEPTLIEKVGRFASDTPYELLGSEVVFRTFERHYRSKFTTVGHFPRECVEIAAQLLHFYICSSAALEYYGARRHLSLQYAHLDMVLVEVADVEAFTGLLPELWGVQPMSASTKAFTKEKVPNISELEMLTGG